VRTPIPGPWRLSELEKEPGIVVERGQMEKKSLFDALGEKGVPKSEVYRIIKSLDGVRKFDKSKKKDRFAVAFEKGSKKVKAFEYETSPSEIWQARAGDGGLLTGAKLDMKVGEEEYSGAFYVSSDVGASLRAAGFEDGLLAALDEALAGHMSTEGFEEGGTVRVIAVEETALGLFSRYKRVVAMEYRPPDPAGKPLRVYTFNGSEARGYWDDKGHQPNAGGWRAPCPGAPVTSPFNPKRLHPVLHTVMPHTGTDFGAAMGAPIYTAYRGTVGSIGPLGPCGNAVVLQHAKGIETGYCHMSRFAPGVKVGDKVGTHQLVGYVGATGRATGPHLHFFVKKNGQFVDSRTLHLDGDRPVPAVDRQAFMNTKAELDRRLEAIPLPDPPPPAEQPVAAATGSSSAEPEAPPAGTSAADSRPGKGGRRAVQIGSPDAIAAAKAEPGIHPSQFVESKGEDDDDGPPPETAAPPPPGTKGKAKGKPDPAEDDDDP
jgi:murein DD-endopeptidase MepM/ murein hydrolase activator NlpD